MKKTISLLAVLMLPVLMFASEANLVVPPGIKNQSLLYWGFLITIAGFMFGLFQFLKVKKLVRINLCWMLHK